VKRGVGVTNHPGILFTNFAACYSPAHYVDHFPAKGMMKKPRVPSSQIPTNPELATEVDQIESELWVLRRQLDEVRDTLNELLAWKEGHERACARVQRNPSRAQRTLF
jgi:hypothetical protein